MKFINMWLLYPNAGHARAAIAALVVALLISPSIGLGPVLADEDARDRPYVMDQVNQALETQKTEVETRWLNPETGNGGIIVVERTFYRDTGEPCRDYRRTLEQPGAPPLVFLGTGCRVSPARWEIDEMVPAPTDKPKTAAAKVPDSAKKTASRQPAPAPATKTTPATTTETKSAAVDKSASCLDPAASTPPVTLVKAPCGKPPPFATYTLPSKAEL